MTDLELAAYLDGGLAEPAKARVERHLATCAECREHMVETRVLLNRVSRPRRIFKISAALAAAVAVILLINPAILRRGSSSDLVRSSSLSAQIIAYGPTGDVSRKGLAFVWAAEPLALSYRVTVTGGNGSTLWTGSTTDTTIALPDSVRLVVGETYYWVSDAVTSDGRTSFTVLKQFTVRR